MKKIQNRNIQTTFLEGFGTIEIEEGMDGKWMIDLFPRGYDNNSENIMLEVKMRHSGDKYFTFPREIQKKFKD